MPDEQSTILLIGHGSRSVLAKQEFYQLAGLLRQRLPGRQVACAFLEFVRPTIAETIAGLVQQGVNHIQVLPLMLMTGKHTKRDIPMVLDACQRQHNITIDYGSELGSDVHMLALACSRIEEGEPGFGISYDRGRHRRETLVVVVGHGTTDAEANIGTSHITNHLQHTMGFGWAATAYAGLAEPLLPQCLQFSRNPACRHIMVLPYFLFAGHMVDKIQLWCSQYRNSNPAVSLVIAPYLNAHSRVVDTLQQRLRDMTV